MDDSAPVNVAEQFAQVKSRVLLVGCGGTLVVLALLFVGFALHNVCLPVLGAIMTFPLALYVKLGLYRCPNCEGYPGRGFWGFPRHCQNCGAALE